MAILYADVLLVNPEEPDEETEIITTVTRLLSGKFKVQASPDPGQVFNFVCHTQDPADITALYTKIGTAGTLAVDGVQYTNCYIQHLKKINEGNGNYTYEISLVRDTT